LHERGTSKNKVQFALVRMHDIHGATRGRPAYRYGKTAGFSLILGERKEIARRQESSCSFDRLQLAGFFQVAPSIDKLAPLLMSADQLHNPEQGFAAPIMLILKPRTRAVAFVLASRPSSFALCRSALDFDWTSN